MTGPRRRLLLLVAAAVVVVAAVVAVTVAVTVQHTSGGRTTSSAATAPATPVPTVSPSGHSHKRDRATPAPSNQSAVAPGPAPNSLPSGAQVSCPPATVTVSTAEQLTAALRAARPGASIHLADGVYTGTFVAANSGTATAPVWLCGGRGAVLDGGGTSSGYALHLAPARYWRVVGFTLRNAQKGVVADGTSGTVVQGLLVEQIGDEGIHLRAASSGNAVLGNTVQNTGLHSAKFGEGIYIGSAVSNWDTYSAGGPDRSDHNLVQGNTISNTTAENVDIKEGTTGGALIGNFFDGAGTTAADSWVDVKGNNWLIADNVGHHATHDGFQTHQVVDGWGSNNLFRANTAADRGTGVDFYVHKPDDTHNQVLCDNRGPGGGSATSNTSCTA